MSNSWNYKKFIFKNFMFSSYSQILLPVTNKIFRWHDKNKTFYQCVFTENNNISIIIINTIATVIL